ncbi:uncharacterized protein LOC133537365 [Nerophis ophidion]|uniref:uncharacterized protein LOC133537365 n=1 Tax=Nerophis ophidion TaxID=159077 RepID=UPI002AE05310|nr:uncharacterized protein LOC133537365 [Nerophis ophidion]
MQSIPGLIIASSKNGMFNDDLTNDWLQRAVGKFNFGPRLLAWDSYRCHISEATKAELKRGYNITMAVISGGFTKYLRAPNVVWNGPFKAQRRDYYDNWMAGDKDKTYTKSGNLRAQSRRLLVDWVLEGWDALDRDTLINSFKVCGLTVAADGSEDQLFTAVVQEEEESDEEQQFLNELVIEEEDDDEGGEGRKRRRRRRMSGSELHLGLHLLQYYCFDGFIEYLVP